MEGTCLPLDLPLEKLQAEEPEHQRQQRYGCVETAVGVFRLDKVVDALG
jgi:hypothetical protein